MLGDCEHIAIAAVGSLKLLDAKAKFYHRVNTDGTVDSICLRCFLTAVKAKIGSDLQELEAAHECYSKQPFILTEYLREL